ALSAGRDQASFGRSETRSARRRHYDGEAGRRAFGMARITSAMPLFERARIADGGPAPLYLKLKRLVTDAIAQGKLADRDAIPGERDLARMLGISRVTVRKAFADLVAEGILVQRRGSGTFVAPKS